MYIYIYRIARVNINTKKCIYIYTHIIGVYWEGKRKWQLLHSLGFRV